MSTASAPMPHLPLLPGRDEQPVEERQQGVLCPALSEQQACGEDLSLRTLDGRDAAL